jgi:hypothetical protein
MNRIIGINRFGLNPINRLTCGISSPMNKSFYWSSVRFGCNVGDYGDSNYNNSNINTSPDKYIKYKEASLKHDLLIQIENNENKLLKSIQDPESANATVILVLTSMPISFSTLMTMTSYINNGCPIVFPCILGSVSLYTIYASVYYYRLTFDKTDTKNALIKDKMLLKVLTDDGYYTNTIKTSDNMSIK